MFFEEKTDVIELERNLCGYFAIITSDDMTAGDVLELYKERDESEKMLLSDRTFFGNCFLRVGGYESAGF